MVSSLFDSALAVTRLSNGFSQVGMDAGARDVASERDMVHKALRGGGPVRT